MPDHINVAIDNLALATELCRENLYGVEIQSFLDPAIVADILDDLGDLHPRSLHGPFGDLCPGSYDPLIREVTLNRFELACTFARQLECQDIILHHGFIPSTSSHAKWLQRCTAFWQGFLEDKEQSLRFHVENMLERDASLLAEVIDAVDDPRVDVCLDIGHCHCNSRETPIEWVERLGTRIGWVHLHNNHGESDEHLTLGEGTIPMEETCRALLECSPNAVWCLEALDDGLASSIEWMKAHGYA